MELLRDKTEYVIKFKQKELYNIWWVLNDYLIENMYLKENNPELYRFITKFIEDFEFINQ